MKVFHGMNISASALTAQRFRMDVIASNMANAETTRANFIDGQWQPYRRKMVYMEPTGSSFNSFLGKAMKESSNVGNGVQVKRVVEDETPFKMVYNPEHPDANDDGYVAMPNVDPLKEMIDLMSATRSYEANVTVFNATKGMMMKALDISK